MSNEVDLAKLAAEAQQVIDPFYQRSGGAEF